MCHGEESSIAMKVAGTLFAPVAGRMMEMRHELSV